MQCEIVERKIVFMTKPGELPRKFIEETYEWNCGCNGDYHANCGDLRTLLIPTDVY